MILNEFIEAVEKASSKYLLKPRILTKTDNGANEVTPEEFLDEVFEILLKEKLI